MINERRPHPALAAQHPTPWEPTPAQLQMYLEYAKGAKSQTEIAEEFGCKQPNICRLFKKINGWLVQERMDDIRCLKAEHEQHLIHIFHEAMRAWNRSNTPSRKNKTQAGHSKYLQTAIKALQDIRKIWGADSPLKVEHSGEQRVAGQSREESIKQRIDYLQGMITPSEN